MQNEKKKAMKYKKQSQGNTKIQFRSNARQNSGCCEQRDMKEVYKVQAVGMRQFL